MGSAGGGLHEPGRSRPQAGRPVHGYGNGRNLAAGDGRGHTDRSHDHQCRGAPRRGVAGDRAVPRELCGRATPCASTGREFRAPCRAGRAAAACRAGGGMISLRKRYANWLNARASTGPRTAAGKARVAQNARKHGLRVPALRDPAMTKSIGELARKLAGPTADARRFEAACQLVAAQIDLLRIRQARLPLLSRVTEGRTAVRNLTTLDLYERYARSRRKSAMRQFNSTPVAATSGQAIPSEASSNEIDIAACSGKSRCRTSDRESFPSESIGAIPGLREDFVQPGWRFCANKANAVREQSQLEKIKIKQCSKMNSARSEGKRVPATAWMRVAERGEPAMPTSRLIAMFTLAASMFHVKHRRFALGNGPLA